MVSSHGLIAWSHRIVSSHDLIASSHCLIASSHCLILTQMARHRPAHAGSISMVRVNASRAMPARLSISTQASVGWLGSSTLCKRVACWKTSCACSFGTTGDRPTSRINSTASRMCPTHSLYDCCKAIEKNMSSLASVHCKRELTRVVFCQAQVTNAF